MQQVRRQVRLCLHRSQEELILLFDLDPNAGLPGVPDATPHFPAMPRQRVRVELSTHRGRVFSGIASSIELRTVEGLIAITPWEKSYLSLIHTTEITVRIGNEFHAFIMENATASLSEGLLTVLAEEIRPAVAAAAQASDPGI